MFAPTAPAMRPEAGFTLIELMIGITLIAVLLAVGTPAFREAAMNVRMTSQANDLISALQLARSEAVKLNSPVFLCASNDQATCNSKSWADGWIVFIDSDNDGKQGVAETAIRTRPALEGGNTLASSGHIAVSDVPYVPYRPTGLSAPGGVRFVLCDTRTTTNAGRRIDVSNTGRPQVRPDTCPTDP